MISETETIEVLPGGYAHEGPGVDSPEWQDSAVQEVLAALGQIGDDNDPEGPRTSLTDSKPFDESTHSTVPRDGDGLVEADIVDYAEPIFEAKDVKNDHWRNLILAVFGCLMVCAIVVTALVLTLTEDDDEDFDGEEICRPPPKIQTIPASCCHCSNSTGKLYYEMGDEGKEQCDNEMKFLINCGMFENELLDTYSCDPFN
jgi:hypothetical protein